MKCGTLTHFTLRKFIYIFLYIPHGTNRSTSCLQNTVMYVINLYKESKNGILVFVFIENMVVNRNCRPLAEPQRVLRTYFLVLSSVIINILCMMQRAHRICTAHTLAGIILHSRSQQTYIFLITLTYYTTHSFIPSFDCENTISSQVFSTKEHTRALCPYYYYSVFRTKYCKKYIILFVHGLSLLFYSMLIRFQSGLWLLHMYLKLLQTTNINIISVF